MMKASRILRYIYSNDVFTRLPPQATALMQVDLARIRNNYHLLQKWAGIREVGAVVKANAYGLGAREITSTLYQAGCRHFFVAYIDEALALRQSVLPLTETSDTKLYILTGLLPDTEELCYRNQLIPFLGSSFEVSSWNRFAQRVGTQLDAVLHCDTGMARTGFEVDDLLQLSPYEVSNLRLLALASHFASSDEPLSPQNDEQIHRFASLSRAPPSTSNVEHLTSNVGHSTSEKNAEYLTSRVEDATSNGECSSLDGEDSSEELLANPSGSAPDFLPCLSDGVPRSLSNSCGIALTDSSQCQLARAGLGIYGLARLREKKEPLECSVRLSGRVVAVRSLPEGRPVGYNARYRTQKPTRVATVAVGHADGLSQAATNKLKFRDPCSGLTAPGIGTISMDLTTVDVTALPSHCVQPGGWLDYVYDVESAEMMALAMGCSVYEVITHIGQRHHRIYINP